MRYLPLGGGRLDGSSVGGEEKLASISGRELFLKSQSMFLHGILTFTIGKGGGATDGRLMLEMDGSDVRSRVLHFTAGCGRL
jgi:hypothetical protein